MLQRRFLTFLLLVLVLMTIKPSLAQEVVVIVHPDVPVDSIDQKTIEKIFYGKKSRWSDDQKITPVTLKNGPVHDEFVNEILLKSTYQFVTYWKQAVFTGKGFPPKSFNTEAELKEYVAQTPGAIGYITRAVVDNSVKIITLE